MQQPSIPAKRPVLSLFSYKKNVNTLALYEKLLRGNTMVAAIVLVVLFVVFFFTLVMGSMPSIKAMGFQFLTGSEWDPVTSRFGAVPFLFGTLLTSVLALIISTPFSIGLGLLLGEYY